MWVTAVNFVLNAAEKVLNFPALGRNPTLHEREFYVVHYSYILHISDASIQQVLSSVAYRNNKGLVGATAGGRNTNYRQYRSWKSSSIN